MGTKRNPGSFDCYSNAEPDEPMFILLGRDPCGGSTVRDWVGRRIVVQGESPDDAKLAEAMRCAEQMDDWCRLKQEAKQYAAWAEVEGPKTKNPDTWRRIELVTQTNNVEFHDILLIPRDGYLARAHALWDWKRKQDVPMPSEYTKAKAEDMLQIRGFLDKALQLLEAPGFDTSGNVNEERRQAVNQLLEDIRAWKFGPSAPKTPINIPVSLNPPKSDNLDFRIYKGRSPADAKVAYIVDTVKAFGKAIAASVDGLQRQINEHVSKAETILEKDNPEATRDILSLVMDAPPTLETIKSWTEHQRKMAEEWAGLIHAHASDNDDIECKAKPVYVQPGPFKLQIECDTLEKAEQAVERCRVMGERGETVRMVRATGGHWEVRVDNPNYNPNTEHDEQQNRAELRDRVRLAWSTGTPSDAGTVRDVLGLVLHSPPPLDVIITWDDEERSWAVDWALAEDTYTIEGNEDVRLPRPSFIGCSVCSRLNDEGTWKDNDNKLRVRAEAAEAALEQREDDSDLIDEDPPEESVLQDWREYEDD